MKFDFEVSRIEKSQGGIPYVYIVFAYPNDFRADTDKTLPKCPFDPNQTTITSPEDLMKNLPNAMANIGKAMGGGFPTDSPTFKISMSEYEDMSIKAGDKVTIEIKKAESSGI